MARDSIAGSRAKRIPAATMASALVRTTILATPPLPLLVDPSVFDGFNWARSSSLEWRCLGELRDNPLSEDPSRMAFVFRSPEGVNNVPAELARLHVGRAYGLEDELCLAPFAIDDATDQLFEQRIEPASALWLATDNLDGLYWGLHDWAHFHCHGAFYERVANELQCDAAALAWLWINREQIGIDHPRWSRLRADVLAAHERRCVAHPPTVPVDASVLERESIMCALADGLVTTR